MNQPISFIIPAYNCADTIGAAIQSIIVTNLSEGDEVVVVDDASTDNTFAVLLSLQKQYPFIKLYRHNINKGSAAAGRNTGIDQSSNELIFCLDSDNILYPNSVVLLKNFLLQNNLDVAAFGRIDYFTDSPQQVTESWILEEQLDFIQALNQPMKTPCGSGNFLYTKAVWKKVGRYNESLGGAYDSELFGLKLLAEGARFWTLPQTAYLHRKGYESTFVREYGKRNPSLLFLAGLIDYWSQVHEDDVAYIFGSGRLKWMDEIEHRPLRRRGSEAETALQHLVKRVKRKAITMLEK